MKSIGIKLADGSFYPLIQEGNPERKSLDLTTVMDNQTKVQVEVYRTETGTLEGAEYLDTLEIKNLKPHQNGEPTLLLDINIDEDNELSAEIRDPETGKKSDIQVTLISKTLIKEKGLSPENTDGEETKLAPKQDEEFAFDDVNESLTQNQEEETTETSADEIQLSDDLPDFDDEFSAESDTLSDSDISEINLNEENKEAEKTSEEDEDFNSPILNFDSAFEENKEDDPFADDSTTLDMETLNNIAADATESNADESEDSPLPDFDDLDTGSDSLDDPFAPEESVEDPFADNSFADSSFSDDPFAETSEEDFSLPDFGDDLEETGSSDIENNSFFNEEPVKDPTFQPSTNMFSNLYDDDSYPEKESNKKTLIPMIICILCAIICITAVVLFVFKGFKFKKTEKTETKAKEEIVSVIESAEDPDEETEAEFTEEVKEDPKADVAAVEDTIVVAETPAQIIPEKPAPSPEKIPDVRYKIKWGDTLWDICKAYYKNPWKYKFLARYNGIKNPDRIISGNIIYIPAE